MSEAQIVGTGFAAAGAIPLVLAMFFFLRTWRFLRRAVDTSGTVVDHKITYGQNGGNAWRPIVAFTPPAGAPVQFTDTVGSSRSRTPQLGETRPVKYDPERPRHAKIATPFRLWFLPGLLAWIGGGFVLVGVVVLALGG